MIPVVALSDLKLKRWTQGERYQSADLSFASLLGLKRLGISYNEVPPGKTGCPFHNHRAEDELFVILEGTGIDRYGGDQQAIRPGDVLGASAGGCDTADQNVNTGHDVLR